MADDQARSMADIYARSGPPDAGRWMSEVRISGPVVVLSPHFDDAALSVSGILSCLAEPVLMVTVCGGVPSTDDDHPAEWDARCGFETASAAAARRAAEDAESCRTLGFQSLHLGERDSAYASDMRGGRRPMPRLREYLADQLDSGHTVFVPLGVGSHPDHTSVRRAALETLSTMGVTTVWAYADLPYASILPGWGSADWNDDGRGEHLWQPDGALIEPYQFAERRPVTLGLDEWRRKRDAILAHASQLVALGHYFEFFLHAQGPLRHELIWRLEKAPC